VLAKVFPNLNSQVARGTADHRLGFCRVASHVLGEARLLILPGTWEAQAAHLTPTLCLLMVLKGRSPALGVAVIFV
jgi:hypothetical protein